MFHAFPELSLVYTRTLLGEITVVAALETKQRKRRPSYNVSMCTTMHILVRVYVIVNAAVSAIRSVYSEPFLHLAIPSRSD